jgi:hypothetical protein
MPVQSVDWCLSENKVLADKDDMSGAWLAFYRSREDKWELARDARGLPILCETKALAISVAGYRRRRLRIWK